MKQSNKSANRQLTMSLSKALDDSRERTLQSRLEAEIERLRAALIEIAKEQSGLTAQSVADRFQRIARDALNVNERLALGGDPEKDKRDWDASKERAKDAGY